jgi:protein-L-isoaspartate(D-aspartate) O-methyltransferase
MLAQRGPDEEKTRMYTPLHIAKAVRGANLRARAAPAYAAPSPLGDVFRRHCGRVGRIAAWCVLALALSPAGSLPAQPPPGSGTSQPFAQRGADSASYRQQRERMVEEQVRRRGVAQPSLLSALREVPRHLFVPEKYRNEAYEDRPVGLETGNTLPQAYVSARMISLLGLKGGEKVLEIGTGSGYDSALLSQLAAAVDSIEIDRETGSRAERLLRGLGYQNVTVHIGDGYRGLPEKAPFDAILVTAAPQKVPEPLFEQLAVGGRMVVAVGFSLHQDLQVITKTEGGGREVRRVSLINLAPMTGEVNQQN